MDSIAQTSVNLQIATNLADFGQLVRENILNYGRQLNQILEGYIAEQSKQKGKRLFNEWLLSVESPWSKGQLESAMLVAAFLDGLPETQREMITQSTKFWSFEALVELAKTPWDLLEMAIALGRQTASQLRKWLDSFKAPKHLVLGKSVTEGHWKLIASSFALEPDGYESEQLREKAKAIAPDGELTTDQLLTLLNSEGYDGDSLLPPMKAKTYTPEDIRAIEQKAKEEVIAQFQQHFDAQQQRIEALEIEREEQSRVVSSLASQQEQLLAKVANLEAQLNRSGKSSKNQPPEWMRLNSPSTANNQSSEPRSSLQPVLAVH